jgi:hypothetical protein
MRDFRSYNAPPPRELLHGEAATHIMRGRSAMRFLKRDRSVRLLGQSLVFSEVLSCHSQRLSIALTRQRVDRRVRSDSEVP